jgi:hypothetical protein
MAATITIDADTRDAERGLDRINGKLDELRREMQRTDDAGGAMPGLGAARIAAASTGFLALGAAIMGVGRVADFAGAKIQAFFESSAEGRAVWEEIDMQFKSANGALGELILGTSDVAEAGELVRDVMGDVVAIIRGVGAATEPVVRIFRDGLVGVLDTVANLFGRAKDEADEYAAATARVAVELRELQELTTTYDQTLVEAVQGTDDYQMKLGKLEELAYQAADGILAMHQAEVGLVHQGEITERFFQDHTSIIDYVKIAYANMREQIAGAIIAGEDLDRGFGAVAEKANALGSSIARIEIDNLADDLQRLNIIVGTQSLPFFDTFGQVVADLQAIIEGDGEPPEPPGPTAPALRNQIELLDELTKAQLEAKNAARAELEQTQRTEAMIMDLRQRQIDSAIEAYNEARALEEEQQREINAIAERAAQERLAIQAEEHRQQQAADAAAQAARQSIFASVGGAMAGLIQAEGDAMTRVRKVLGQELVARGQAALAQAAIMAATLNPAAAGVAAAGLGAIALGKRFGAGGGGMGAGRGGGGGGRSATVTQNITFAGGAAGQDTRAIAAAIGRASRDGVLEGMA